MLLLRMRLVGIAGSIWFAPRSVGEAQSTTHFKRWYLRRNGAVFLGTAGIVALSSFLAACAPQDGDITAFHIDNRTAQSVVVEYELVGGETQISGVIATDTEEVLFTSFGSCLEVSIIAEARVYSASEGALLRTVTESSEWRKEPRSGSCFWSLELG